MSDDLSTLVEALDGAMLRDAHRLGQRLRRAQRRVARGQPVDRTIATLEREIAASCAAVEARRASVPGITLPDELPISAHADEIIEKLASQQVIIVCGETGSGKSTQLPKLCLRAGRGVRGTIGHTQPRRVAARALAARIGTELGVPDLSAYKIRFADRTSPGTLVKLMTDGVLLNELRSDRELRAYDTIIVDEAHERSLNVDFILGVLKRLLASRPDLRVVVTSATIAPDKFARYFDDAEIIEVSGRGYPVEVRHRPVAESSNGDTPIDGIVDALREISASPQGRRGDTLVFLPGERQIREAAEALRKGSPELEVLPLYGRLSAAEQDRVFKKASGRRVVLATNVAETSLTVPGVTSVIDTGLARISRYSHRTKIQRLPIESVSQASAKQRLGRCGRVAPGLCVRLYSEEDLLERDAYTDPEVLRTNLASVILQMVVLGLGEIEHFPFLDPPDRRAVNDGYRLLQVLQAVDDERRATPLGREMARLPLDPRIARALLAGAEVGCPAETLIVVCALAIADPRERPSDKAALADAKHALFDVPGSDFLALLALWEAFHAQAKAGSRSALRRWCREHFVSYLRMREWKDLHAQLRGMLSEEGVGAGAARGDPADVHRALLRGFIDRIGHREEGKDYLGPRNLTFRIFPGSSLHGSTPRWIMAASIIETSRPFALMVARLRRSWLEEAGAHLLRREYFDAHWNAARARVDAFERANLFGLQVHTKRRVNYGTIAPDEAHDIFLREALVGDRLRTRARFRKHNDRLRRELRVTEAKLRRHDVIAGELQLHGFFSARVPADIWSATAFDAWRRNAERQQPRLLYLSRTDLLRPGAPEAGLADYPDTCVVTGNPLKIRYRFEPGDPRDGATLTVPAVLLGEITRGMLDRLVPGHLDEQLECLLRGLPKAMRRELPAMQECRLAVQARVSAGRAPLLDVLTQALRETYRLDVSPRLWREDVLPAHLRVNVRVVDGNGRQLAQGRDLDALQAQLLGRVPDPRPADDGWRAGIRSWDFGELRDELMVAEGHLSIRAYPTLQDRGDSVALGLRRIRTEAVRDTADGIVRLALLALPQQEKWIVDAVKGIRHATLLANGIDSPAVLGEHLAGSVFREVLLPDENDPPRTESDFTERLERHRADLIPLAERRVALLAQALQGHRDLRVRLLGAPDAWQEPVGDMLDQLDALLHAGFVRTTPPAWLAELPRYLRAVDARIDKLAVAFGRDATLAEPIRQAWRRYQSVPESTRDAAGQGDALTQYRWMIEEFRVSVFAQTLGTRVPVSAKRLDKQWSTVKSELSP